MKWLCTTRNLSKTWSWRAGKSQIVSNHEVVDTHQSPEGTLLQQTRPWSGARDWPGLEAFEQQRRIWTRRLRQAPVDRLLLSCVWRQIRHERSGFTLLRPIWTLNLVLTTPALGRILINHCYHGSLPPTRLLLERIQALQGIRRLEERPYEGETIHFTGSVLLDGLGSALDVAKDRLQTQGQWVPLGKSPAPEFETDQDQTLRFEPNQTSRRTGPVWTAYLYEGENNAVLCRQPDRSWVRLLLKEPLYRYLGQLQFGTRFETRALKDQVFMFPEAWLAIASDNVAPGVGDELDL